MEFLPVTLTKQNYHEEWLMQFYEQTGSGLKATLEDGTSMEADVIMYATGRKPRTEDLGLEQAGVKMDKNGAIVVSYLCLQGGYCWISIAMLQNAETWNVWIAVSPCGVISDFFLILQVDEAFQTSVGNVYAVGDVINRIQLTPVRRVLL